VVRQVVAYKNYFLSFYRQQTDDVQKKIEWTLNLIRTTRHVPSKFLDHITGTKGLYEVRVEVGGSIFRIFCFFEKDNLVVLGNGFQKKSPKTPKTEIQRALRIMQEYKDEKGE